MTREGERELVKVEHVNGGDGYIVREAMVTSEEVGEACKMYGKIHLDPGSCVFLFDDLLQDLREEIVIVFSWFDILSFIMNTKCYLKQRLN